MVNLIKNTKNPLIIIAHQAICRIIYAYLMDIKYEDCTCLEIKSHRLYEFNEIDNGNKYSVKYHDI
jgi:broad specificity phosphatase PhoE